VKNFKKLVKIFLMSVGWFLIYIMRALHYFKVSLPVNLLVVAHLLRSGNPRHPNTRAFIKVLKHFQGQPIQIIETGTSAWGADSTRLWDEYIRLFGGKLVSVDLRSEPSTHLKGKLSKNSFLEVGDSVAFLKQLQQDGLQADLIYLDSFDVDWNNPEPAELHGEAEFIVASNLVHVNGIILIDDTPTKDAMIQMRLDSQNSLTSETGIVRGKGGRVFRLVEASDNFEILYHDYAVAVRKIK